MLGRGLRHHFKRFIRIGSLTLCAVLVLDLLNTFHNFKIFETHLVENTINRVEDLPADTKNQHIYIVAQFWTSADILQVYWQHAILDLIDTLGVDKVYLSILATKGLDDTDQVLRNMEADHLQPRNVSRTIIIDPCTHQDEINRGPVDENGKEQPGWIHSGDSRPPGQKEMRRIPYLARLRNQSLEPMLKMQKEQGIMFDKILFLNDVIFQTSDVLSLLATNHGFYDVACSIDYHLDSRFYDSFVLRDSNYEATATRYYPMFRSAESRNAVLRGLPTPVKSCWNGMVVADAAPYYDAQPERHTSATGSLKVQPTEGLRFRGVADSLAAVHVEGSECCLIHADLIERGLVKKGLYMNPSVRVGYTRNSNYKTTAYQDVHIGPNGLGWVSVNRYITGIWVNRFSRWFKPAWLDTRTVMKRVKQWKKEGKKIGETREEFGTFCIIDEMHILISNGWKHVGSRALH